MGKYDTYVEECTAHFKALLEEQLEREDRMEADDEKKDFANLDHIVIGFCGGDGIGCHDGHQFTPQQWQRQGCRAAP